MINFRELTIIDNWLKSQSNGDWEHHNGVTIESTDNPGWMMRIDLPSGLFKDEQLLRDALLKFASVEWLAKDEIIILYSSSLVSLVQGAASVVENLK